MKLQKNNVLLCHELNCNFKENDDCEKQALF